MSEEKPVELSETKKPEQASTTPEQKEQQEKVTKFRKAVEVFVLNKVNNDFEVWYATRNIIQNPMKLEVVAGKTFEPHVRDSVIWVGALWTEKQ